MTLAEAKTVIERAFPGQGVQLVAEKGTCKVIHPKDGVIGNAFGWLPALREACKPVLAAADKARLNRQEAQRKDFELFMEFIREELHDKFELWKTARAAAPTSDPAGDPPDQKQLVQVVSG